MTYLSESSELTDLGGGQFNVRCKCGTLAFKDDDGVLRAEDRTWGDSDVGGFGHALRKCAAGLFYTTNAGAWRMCPTRDRAKYVELARPKIMPAASWQSVSLGTPTRANNRIGWNTANFAAGLVNFGGKVGLKLELKNNYRIPNNKVAIPVTLNGLTFSGGKLLDAGREVSKLHKPFWYNADADEQTHPVAWDVVQISGSPHLVLTWADLPATGRWVLDPTWGDDAYADATISGAAGYVDTDGNASQYNRVGYNATPGIQRAIVRIDAEGNVPSNATITAWTYKAYLYSEDMTASSNVLLYGLKRNWQYTGGGVTWNQYDNDANLNWGTAGAMGAADISASWATLAFTSTPTTGAWHTWTLSATRADLTAAPYGVLMRCDVENNARLTFSGGNTGDNNEPEHSITYTLPGNSYYYRMNQ